MDPDDNSVDDIVYTEEIRKYVRIFPLYFIIVVSVALACAIEFSETCTEKVKKEHSYWEYFKISEWIMQLLNRWIY